jgi:acyl-CoA synthetase (AMP-forming)/AMP-acid ligase II
MKQNPPKEKLVLKEYLVGGSALPKSLIEGFDKDFGIKGVQAWGMTETSPLGSMITTATLRFTPRRTTNYSGKTRNCISGC